MGFTIPGRDVPVVICSILFTSIAFIVVICRLYTRVIMLQNAGPDDYIMTAAMVNSFLTPFKHPFVETLRNHCWKRSALIFTCESRLTQSPGCLHRILRCHLLP
jgi:hypothetical protein